MKSYDVNDVVLEDGDYRVRLDYDLAADSPLEIDEDEFRLWTRVVSHIDVPDGYREESFEWLMQQAVEDGARTILPVFAYQHGGIALSVSEFSDPWDSGKCGIIWSKEDMTKAEAGAHVDRVTEWLNGNVFALVVESKVEYQEVDGERTLTQWDYVTREGNVYVEDIEDYAKNLLHEARLDEEGSDGE